MVDVHCQAGRLGIWTEFAECCMLSCQSVSRVLVWSNGLKTLQGKAADQPAVLPCCAALQGYAIVSK